MGIKESIRKFKIRILCKCILLFFFFGCIEYGKLGV